MTALSTLLPLYLQTRASTDPETPVADLFDARAADILFPGQVEMNAPDGSGGFVCGDQDAWELVVDYLKTWGFRVFRPDVGTLTINAAAAPAWTGHPFVVSELPLTAGAVAASTGLINLFNNRVLTFNDSLPGVLQNQIRQLLSAGLLIVPAYKDAAWIGYGEAQATWSQTCDAAKSIISAFANGRVDDAAAQVAAAENNVAWADGFYRVTAAIATGGLSELQRKIDEARAALRKFTAVKQAALSYAATATPYEASQIQTALAQQEAAIRTQVSIAAALVPSIRAEAAAAGLGTGVVLAEGAAAGVGILAMIKLIAIIVAAIAALVVLGPTLWAAVKAAAAAGNAVAKTIDMLGPVAGFAILAGLGWWAWTKFGKRTKNA